MNAHGNKTREVEDTTRVGEARPSDDGTPPFDGDSDQPIEVAPVDIVDSAISWRSMLEGLRFVVAEDDAVVRQRIREILEGVGAQVIAVDDGHKAMAVIREHRPDVLITDILMPELDGWEILSMVRRDVLLWDTPVVVLSWREDFLQRLRDLEVEANAYLLKESDRSHILASVSETVAERRQIAQRVSESDDASGRVEQIGIVPLLDALAGRRGTARLVVRETWNVFEVTLRMRTVLDVRHLVDGMPRESGVSALRLLLGVRSGRFTVSTPLWREDGAVLGPYDQILAAAARPFQELVDLVTNGVFLRSTTLALRPELLPRYLETTPRRVHMVVDAFRTGSQPIELIAEGRVTLSAMESIMLDMVRRGIVLEMHPQADHIATSS